MQWYRPGTQSDRRGARFLLQARRGERKKSEEMTKSWKRGSIWSCPVLSQVLLLQHPLSSAVSWSSAQTKISTFIPKQVTPAEQISVNEELAKIIASDFQPLSIVEDKVFTTFVQALNSMYVLISRKTLSQTQLYNKERALWQDTGKTTSTV